MTVEQAMQRALALLPVKPELSDGLMEFGPAWASLAAAECLPAENALRASKGEKELERMPELLSLADEIPLDPVLTGSALIYALASLAAKDDGDMQWMQILRNRFSGALQELTPYVEGVVRDHYGGERLEG